MRFHFSCAFSLERPVVFEGVDLAGALGGDVDVLGYLALGAQFEQAWHHLVTQRPGVDGIDVNLSTAFESSECGNPPLEVDAPRHGDVEIDGLGVPLLVGGDEGAGGGVHCVDEVGHIA